MFNRRIITKGASLAMPMRSMPFSSRPSARSLGGMRLNRQSNHPLLRSSLSLHADERRGAITRIERRHVGGPAVRLIVQFVVMASGVFIKAFSQAIAQAQANAAKGGGEPAAAKSFSVKKNAMTDSHAEEILNLPKGGPYTEEEVQKTFDRMFSQNDPAKGGSFYIQSKVYRAKEHLDKVRAEKNNGTSTPSP